MKTRGFEELRVYKLSEKLADEVWQIVGTWDRFAQLSVGGQLVRAADSVGANVAEGCGRGSYNDNKRFIRMARGSLFETRHWLRRAYQRKLLTAAQIRSLKQSIDNLGPQLNSYLKSVGPPKMLSNND
jgi:four helix bundle protein